ncbi:MAG: antitoxin [Labedaea sp.]
MARLLRKLTVVAGAAGAATQYAKKHPDQVNRWAEKTASFVDKRTNGKYRKQIKGAVQKVRSATTS